MLKIMLTLSNNHLKYPPIKNTLKKIPDKLVYYSNNSKLYHDFIISTTTKPYKTCRMYCNVAKLHLEGKVIPSIYVYMIASSPIKNGLGSNMLKIVEKFSKDNGCNGRFHLFADTSLFPQEIPQVFYRKFGMTTGDKKTDAKLDKFIKKKKPATNKDFKSTLMYYPPLDTPKKTKSILTILKKAKNFFHRLLNKYET